MTAEQREMMENVAARAAKAAVDEVREELRKEIGLRIALAKWQLIAMGLGSGAMGGIITKLLGG